MSGSEQFWTSGAWLFLIYGFVVLGVAIMRARVMERRYKEANPSTSPGNEGGEHR